MTRVPYYELYLDGLGFWRWRFRGANHEIIASGEGYYNKSDCRNAIALISTSGTCKVHEV
jgi:uncharacterized protein YegP (UPF0339 family)